MAPSLSAQGVQLGLLPMLSRDEWEANHCLVCLITSLTSVFSSGPGTFKHTPPGHIAGPVFL